MKAPTGTGLVLAGSGVYWILSGSLIASFSVLAPGLLSDAGPAGDFVILASGIVAFASAVWMLSTDLTSFQELARTADGWMFALPLVLASSDIWLTLFGLASSHSVAELNPILGRAVQTGGIIFYACVVSYCLLSEGVGLMMVSLGEYFAGASQRFRALSYSIACGIPSFGALSNVSLLTGWVSAFSASLVGAAASSFLAILVYKCNGSKRV